MASESTTVMAALGRPFTLGMLYDARQDQLIPGVTFWEDKTLQKNIVEAEHRATDFEITTSDSVESRTSLLDVDASLKASFMCGRIEARGSAKYLTDKKKFHNQSRVTLQYKTTTNLKQLFMTPPEPKKMEQIDAVKGLATHVVVSILYGANVFFVFDSEKLDASSVQDIQGRMEAVIKKIPSFNVQGKADIKLTDEEKALTDKISCKYYGDFTLESNPATFENAVKTYVQLPKPVRGIVPLKVWLMPLKNFYSEAAEVMSGISIKLVRKAEEALEDFRQLEMRCNDCLDDKIVKSFLPIHEKLTSFQTLCNYYTAALQEQMAKKVPLIRAGAEDEEDALKKIFVDRDKSPFSHENLNKWMDYREREINIIRSCVEMMEGIKIIPNQSELDREVLASGVDDAFCFVFTSLKTTDPYLQDLGDYVDLFNVLSAVVVAPPSKDQWYFSDEVIIKMREKAKSFYDLAKALKSSRILFFIAAIANEKHKGASIFHYKNGILVSDDFSKPDISDVEKVTDRRELMWYACSLSLDPDTANKRLTLSEGNKKATHGAEQPYPDLPQRFDHFPQILCREGLTGRCYWEVEWSTGGSEDVAVGVSYSGLYRKGEGDECRLGWNVMSWCLGHKRSPEETNLYAKHDKKSHNVPLPATGCSRLGVFLDWPAGSLSYYKVSANTLSHLYTFRSTFAEPVYPAFKICCEKNYMLLCVNLGLHK